MSNVKTTPFWVVRGRAWNDRRYCATPQEAIRFLITQLSPGEKKAVQAGPLEDMVAKQKMGNDHTFFGITITKRTLFG